MASEQNAGDSVLSENKSLVLVFVAIVAMVIVVYMLFFHQSPTYSFQVEKNNVVFLSNDAQPSDVLARLRLDERFVVSPQLAQEGTVNQYMAQSLALFTAVLSAKGRTVVSLVQLVDAEGNIIDCQTNDGNKMVSRDVNLSECAEKLSGTQHVVVVIRLPDSKLAKSQVVLEGNKVVITPKSYNEVSLSCFTTLEGLYPDAADIIKKLNQAIGGIS